LLGGGCAGVKRVGNEEGRGCKSKLRRKKGIEGPLAAGVEGVIGS
jgi:hypothetical protein